MTLRSRLILVAALVAAGLAMNMVGPPAAPVVPSTHGSDGFRKNLFRGVLPFAPAQVQAQQSVGPGGPMSGSSYDGTGVDVIVALTSVTSPSFIGDLTGNVTGSISGSVLNNTCFTIGTTDTAASPCLRYDTTQTVDTGMLLTGTVSNHWVIAERQDEAFDFAHAQTTTPTLFIHSQNQSTTEFISLTSVGSTGVIGNGGGDNGGIQINPNVAGSSANGFTFFRRGTSYTLESSAAAIGQTYIDRVANQGYGFYDGAFARTGGFAFNTTQTPDTQMLYTDPLGNSLILAEYADRAFDFAHAQTTTPTLFIHSHNQSTTQWLSLTHDGSNAQVISGAGNLTLGSASTIVNVLTNSLFAVGTAGAELGYLQGNNVQTVDTAMLLTGSTSNHWVMGEFADRAFDFAHGQATDPTLFIHSAAQSTTQWLGLTHDGTNGVLSAGTGDLVTPQLVVPSGTAAAAAGSIYSASDTDTGLYFVGTDGFVGLSWGGAERFSVQNSGGNNLISFGTTSASFMAANSSVGLGLISSRQYLWSSGTTDGLSSVDTGLARFAAASVKVTDGSSGQGRLYAHTVVVGSNEVSTLLQGPASGDVFVSNGTGGSVPGTLLAAAKVTANTGTATPAVTDSGTVYTNTGDADGSQVTLPNDPTIGTTFTIIGTAAFNITVAPSAGETVMFGNTVCATSLVVSGAATGIGDSLTIVAATGGSGAVWITTASAGTPVCTP